LNCSRAEPGGIYILTGKETGVAEIIETDIRQYPDLYEGVSLDRYIDRFRQENDIGRRRLSPGDTLRFPETPASLELKSAPGTLAASSDSDSEHTHATVTCSYKMGRFKDHFSSCWNADETFIHVPDRYQDAGITLCKKKSREPLKFTVTEPGIVTLVTDKRHKAMLKKNGWAEAAEAGRMNPGGDIFRLFIYEKHLEVGEYSYTKSDLDEPFGIRVVIF
jgi:hypothetical protein